MSMPQGGTTFYCAEWAARAALWLGDAKRALVAVDRLDELRVSGRVPRAIRLEMQAGAAALDGDHARALAGYREAIGIWRELDVPVNLGLCLTDMAIVVGPTQPEGVAAADEARAVWERLGLPSVLARLDEGLSRWPPEQPAKKTAEITESVERSTSA